MNSTHVRNPVLLASFLALAALTSACGGGTPGSVEAPSALSSALEASTAASGTLLCAPADAQVAACASKTAGDACELTPPDGAPAVAGTCRTTIDGAAVACAPNPPAPPQELVEACTGKVAGATCQVAEAFGNSRDGVCVTARDGATLVCGRVRIPPQGAIDACASLAAGDSCTMPGQGAMEPAPACAAWDRRAPALSPALRRRTSSRTASRPAPACRRARPAPSAAATRRSQAPAWRRQRTARRCASSPAPTCAAGSRAARVGTTACGRPTVKSWRRRLRAAGPPLRTWTPQGGSGAPFAPV